MSYVLQRIYHLHIITYTNILYATTIAPYTGMYEKEYPDNDELLVVQVKNVADLGAYVSLLEYNNIEGMILLSELSRRRIRSVNKLIRVGRQEVVVTLRVDKDKGYIDLSKRRVSPEEILKAEDRFNKSKAVHSIMRHVSERCRIHMIELYQQFGWDLYRRFGHAYDAFKLIIQNEHGVLDKYKLRDDVSNLLIENIKRRLTPQAVKIRADIDVNCFSYDGIDAIKAGLSAGEQCSVEGIEVKIKLVAPPLYVVMTSALNKDQGIEVLTKSIDEITRIVVSRGGSVNVKQAPRTVSERDDFILNKMMTELDKQNTQIAADDSDQDAEETGAE